ncbi:MAG TPA: hypothetical protein VKY38_00440 [Azoarcus sp.]|nr:hypothetical protein [Azoarcus sp.]
MNHQEFVDAQKAGTLNAYISQEVAAGYLTRRLWLPLFTLPIIGTGVALALIGWLITGLLVFLFGIALPHFVKRNAVPILMYQALHDEEVFEDMRQAGVLEILDE